LLKLNWNIGKIAVKKQQKYWLEANGIKLG